MCVHVHVHTCVYVHVHTCVCTCARVRAWVCVFVGGGHVYGVSAVPLETVPWRAERALGR